MKKIIMQLDAKARQALRQIQSRNRNIDDCGGMMIPRSTPHRNRKAYDRNRFKRMS